MRLDPNGPRCKGTSRQSGEPCGLPPIPFGDYCRFHGGNRKQHREIARKRMLEYERWSPDPHYIKNIRIRQWKDADRRWEMRKAKKRGPQAVAALKAEWAAERAEKKAWEAENKRLREQRRADYRRQQNAPPPSPGYIPYSGFDFDI